MREYPGLTVHVSEVGLPHLVDPERLETSARRLYGDAFDELWGELVPVPAANVRPVGDSVVGLACFPTTGHARHHVSYLDDDGTLYAIAATDLDAQAALRRSFDPAGLANPGKVLPSPAGCGDLHVAKAVAEGAWI